MKNLVFLHSSVCYKGNGNLIFFLCICPFCHGALFITVPVAQAPN